MLIGKFITIEGIEGTGKSTIAQYIKNHLQECGSDAVLTREPGGTEIAEAIRKLLLNQYEEKMAEDTELLLFFAGRAQHIATVIRPALEMGRVVISDRFTDASFAYQGAGRGISVDRLKTLAHWVLKDLKPDLTILLDVPVEIGLARAKGRSIFDRIESETVAFFERVRQGYLNLAKQFPERYRIIDANQSLDVVKKQVINIINE